jgi:hypothetical protein
VTISTVVPSTTTSKATRRLRPPSGWKGSQPLPRRAARPSHQTCRRRPHRPRRPRTPRLRGRQAPRWWWRQASPSRKVRTRMRALDHRRDQAPSRREARTPE